MEDLTRLETREMDENFRKELNDLSKRVAFIESQLPFDTVKVECERTPEGEVQKLIFNETYVVGDGNLEIHPNGYKPRYSENDLRELFGDDRLDGECFNAPKWTPKRFLRVIKNRIIAESDMR